VDVVDTRDVIANEGHDAATPARMVIFNFLLGESERSHRSRNNASATASTLEPLPLRMWSALTLLKSLPSRHDLVARVASSFVPKRCDEVSAIVETKH
jgi:hypothetical protein